MSDIVRYYRNKADNAIIFKVTNQHIGGGIGILVERFDSIEPPMYLKGAPFITWLEGFEETEIS